MLRKTLQAKRARPQSTLEFYIQPANQSSEAASFNTR